MLSHFPQLHLIIDYGGRRPLPATDEKSVLRALQHHDRIRYIDMYISSDFAEQLFAVMNGPFPVLEHLALCVIYPDIDEDESEGNEFDPPQLPPTFQAPHLQHLDLNRVGNLSEKGLPLLLSLSSLVSLTLIGIPVSFYLPIEYLASRLALMPQLEYLDLEFVYHLPSDDIGKELVNAKRISLPNLSEIYFKGDGSYLEGIAARIIAPLLMSFSAKFLIEPSSTLQHLSGLLSSALQLRLPVASIKFSGTRVDDPNLAMCMASSEKTLDHCPQFSPFHIVFPCQALDVQVASAERICSVLTPMLSAVEKLHLDLDGGRWSPWDDINDIESSTWLNLLRPFRKVEKLQIDGGLIDDMSRALCSNDNGPTMDILPELRKLTRPDYTHIGEAFDKFIATRREAGRHIIKRRRPPIPHSDSEEEEHDNDDSDLEEDVYESDSEDDEDEDDEGQEEPEVDLGLVENEREEVGPNTDTETDPDSGTNDDLEISTELDSDSDLDSEY